MEENTAAVECLILFYINMKYVLKTKQLVERVFIDEMIKHCKESGFKYSNEEIKETWRNVVSKYQSLKSHGTPEEKENWKHFDILESCFERADFHTSSSPKFSDEMVWFLIECFLKRKALRKTHKHSSIVNEVYKEFTQCGYLYITKQDIDNKWRHLNLKYEKLKNNPESLKKWPYLQALKGFCQDSGRHVVNMVFTRELTEILIERFTEKKVNCVIHGYDSDQVLDEIQSEFKDLGFFFPKDDIKEKWRVLTNIYKFLIAKGNRDTSWIYFDAMKTHFKDDFSVLWGEMNKRTEVKGKQRRQRSKSVGPEVVSQISMTANLVVQLEKVSSLHHLKLKDVDKIRPREKKRSISEHRRMKSRKKLKIRRESDTTRAKDGNENKIQSNEISSGNITYFQNNADLQKSFTESPERRSRVGLASPTSNVHIINIDHSEIDHNGGNLTINLPSITKQFSDNEFLPLKKRLRLEGENVGVDSETSNKLDDGFLGFPATQSATQKLLGERSDDKPLTDEEMSGVVGRIDKETSRNRDVGSASNKDLSTNHHGAEQFQNHQSMYPELNRCFISPKKVQRDSKMQTYSGSSAVPQPPVLLLVIKVDGSNNSVKDGTPGEDSAKTGTCSLQNSPNKADEVFEKRTNDAQKQTSGGVTPSRVFNDFIKPISPRGKTIVISNKAKLLPFRLDSKIDGCNSEVTVTGSEQVTANSSNTGNTSVVIEDKTMREKVEETAATKTVPLKSKTSETVVPSQAVKPIVSTGRIRLPVREAGGLKRIFISPSELDRFKFKPQNVKLRTYGSKKPGVCVETNSQLKKFKFISQVVKPAMRDGGDERIANPQLYFNDTVDQYIEGKPPVSPQPYVTGSKFVGSGAFTRNAKNKEFDNESVLSEGIGEDEGSKDTLLATVINFQEQNNLEFIEIKNLMKQNNLLQRETNRLLRLLLEKH